MDSPTPLTTTLDLTTLHLGKGSHVDCTDGYCLYEAYNMLTHDEHTDDCPPDVSRVLYTFGLRLNDSLSDDRRQELKRFLPGPGGVSLLAGTRDDGLDETRSYLALDWLIRTYTPAWLDSAGLTAEAQALRDLRRIADVATAEQAGPVMREACGKARAARAAAGLAAGDAVGDAARNAAGFAALDAAGAAAGAAVWAAALDAVGASAVAAAGASAGAAVWAAARAKLQPTVDLLQTSAIGLFTAMIRPAAA